MPCHKHKCKLFLNPKACGWSPLACFCVKWMIPKAPSNTQYTGCTVHRVYRIVSPTNFTDVIQNCFLHFLSERTFHVLPGSPTFKNLALDAEAIGAPKHHIFYFGRKLPVETDGVYDCKLEGNKKDRWVIQGSSGSEFLCGSLGSLHILPPPFNKKGEGWLATFHVNLTLQMLGKNANCPEEFVIRNQKRAWRHPRLCTVLLSGNMPWMHIPIYMRMQIWKEINVSFLLEAIQYG